MNMATKLRQEQKSIHLREQYQINSRRKKTPINIVPKVSEWNST